MVTRGIRAGLTALVAAGFVALSGCGVVGLPFAHGRPSSSAAPSASPTPTVEASPSPAPKVQPAAGQCQVDDYEETVDLAEVNLADCTGTHIGETVYVGQFTGAAAQASKAPAFDASGTTTAEIAAQASAYATCSSKADKYLGHSWIHIQLELRLTMPDELSWLDGERWYRCDLYQIGWGDGVDVERTGSLKAKWFAPVCLNLNKDNSPIVKCSARHPSEFTGGYLAGATKTEPKSQSQYKPFHNKCYGIVGKYIGVSSSRVPYTTGDSVMFQYDFDLWKSGRRVVYCFTWSGKSSSSYVTGSAKGRHGKGL